jgi:hypothetical protein
VTVSQRNADDDEFALAANANDGDALMPMTTATRLLLMKRRFESRQLACKPGADVLRRHGREDRFKTKLAQPPIPNIITPPPPLPPPPLPTTLSSALPLTLTFLSFLAI